MGKNLNGISSNAAVHTGGLVRMVELRGGLSNLGMRGILRRMVLWCVWPWPRMHSPNIMSDLLASSRLGRPPRFPFYQADTSAPLTVFTPSVSSDTYHLVTNGALDAILTVKHRLSIAQLLLSLHRLSLFLSLTDSLYLPWEASYPDRVYQVEYQFLTALFDDQVTAPTDTQVMVGTILLHAGLLFIYTNLRETPVGGAIRCRLLDRLKAVLVQFESLMHDALGFTAELFWVLLLGASASSAVDQDYFVEQLRKMSRRHNIRSWSHAKMLLESMPALEAYRLNTCMDLWSTVIAPQSICRDTTLY
ncbi:uncharacterized protein SPSK_09603 [Sporothrix schenckii 1099-18]|uniref:Uncharacterized protein n=1 Tax=Sporothrix schenckii 1099-18 TaxID=1397361 RepID=A0A0F2MA98_SPOSC|nr:uncharacterized protein SPSK_09603 [Sporothrix schenckii 1099-18]KJR85086.1 hypothetical protein SPSK_09603 [Sporothrix schenckii 1099-18]